MLGNRRSIAHFQSDFYRYKFYKILRWLMLNIVLIYVLIGIIIYQILYVGHQNYYANTTDGKILPMPPAQITLR